MTPAQGISSFVFYRGKAFRRWRDNKVLFTEVLLKDLARFRDIEVGPRGELYLLLENAGGSRVIRLVPD